MADNEYAAVDAKAHHYAERLRDLIQEAYAEGISLTTSDPDPSFSVTPVDEHEKLRINIINVPVLGHIHASLGKVPAVFAYAITRKAVNGQAEIVPPFPARPLPVKEETAPSN